MRRIKRSILRAQGRMARVNSPHPVRYLRSWCPSIVGSERNPSTPGDGWRRVMRVKFQITGKSSMRRRRRADRLITEYVGGAK